MARMLLALWKVYLVQCFRPVGLLLLRTQWIVIALKIVSAQNFKSFNPHFLKFLLFLLVFRFLFAIVIDILYIIIIISLIILFTQPFLFQCLKTLIHRLLLFIHQFPTNLVLLKNFRFLLILINQFILIAEIISIQYRLN